MTLDQWLKRTGTKAGTLAAQLGVTEASVSRIRRGEQNVSRDLIRLIVEATGGAVTANELVFGDGQGGVLTPPPEQAPEFRTHGPQSAVDDELGEEARA